MCNAAILDVVNNATETIIFKPEEMLGIVDLRKVRQIYRFRMILV